MILEIRENLGTLKFKGDIKVTGSILALSGSGFEADLGIQAGRGITAGLWITAGYGITAGKFIFAGICDWCEPTLEETQITCTELISGTIKYGVLNLVKKEPKKVIDSCDGKVIEIEGKKYKLMSVG